MLKHVDLCSGIGGFALGFEWAGLSTPHLFCDIEPWCRDILKQHWPNVPIKSDVKELANDPDRFIPDCDILTAGYPCQPFSSAGKRKGEEDDRHIWPYIRTIVAHKRPSWVVFENVNGHISLGLDTVLSNLEAEGYTTRPFVIPACSVGAPHRRDRVWIVGHTEDNGCDRGDCGPVGSKSHTHMYDRKYLCATVKMWPTPTATERSGVNPKTGKGAGLSKAVQMWPTPSASEHKAGLPGDKMQKMLGNHPEVRNSGTGTLNPTWVEWLMGYPKGWTELKD